MAIFRFAAIGVILFASVFTWGGQKEPTVVALSQAECQEIRGGACFQHQTKDCLPPEGGWQTCQIGGNCVAGVCPITTAIKEIGNTTYADSESHWIGNQYQQPVSEYKCCNLQDCTGTCVLVGTEHQCPLNGEASLGCAKNRRMVDGDICGIGS